MMRMTVSSKKPAATATDEQAVSENFRNTRLVLLTLVGMLTAFDAALRFHTAALKSLWFDEGVSIAIARLSWYDFARILWRREANMSLYYLLLRGWLHFGHSELLIRSLSILFGMAEIPALYLLARRLFSARIAVTACLLLCVNAYDIRYSQEIRSYSLAILLCILSSIYFLKFTDSPSRRNRALYVVLSSLAVYAQFFSALVVLANFISLRFFGSKPAIVSRKVWLQIAAATSPIILFVLFTGAGPLRWIHRPGPADLWQLLANFSGTGGILLALAYTAACIAAAVPLFLGTKSDRNWSYQFLLLWALFPPLFTFAISVLRPMFVPRYFLMSLPALVLLVACGLGRIRQRWLFAPALLAIFALALRGDALYYHQRVFDLRDNWRGATQSLLADARPDDGLIFYTGSGRMTYEYYRSIQTGVYAAPQVLYPSHGERLTFQDFYVKPDYPNLQHAIAQHARVWLVISQSGPAFPSDPQLLELIKLLSSSDAEVNRRDFGGVEVVLYARPGTN